MNGSVQHATFLMVTLSYADKSYAPCRTAKKPRALTLIANFYSGENMWAGVARNLFCRKKTVCIWGLLPNATRILCIPAAAFMHNLTYNFEMETKLKTPPTIFWFGWSLVARWVGLYDWCAWCISPQTNEVGGSPMSFLRTGLSQLQKKRG